MGNVKSEGDSYRRQSNEDGARVLRTQKEQRSARAEEALRESKEEFEAIFNDVRDGIVLLDMTGRVIKINKRITEVTGYTEEDIVGKRFKSLKMFTPKSVAKMIFSFTKTLGGLERLPYEVEGYTKKGEKRIAEIHGSLLRKKGKAVGVVVSMRDITKRKRAEEALSESEKQFKIIFDTQQNGTIIIDAHSHTIVDVNTYAAVIIGLPREDIIGKVCHSFICPAEKGQCPVSDLRQVIDKSERILFQTEGGGIPILKSVIRTTINGQELLIESFQDITERKVMEEELRKSEANLKKAQEVGHVGSWHLDLKKNEFIWSDEACRIFGIPQGTVLTFEEFLEAVHPDDRDYVDKAWTAALDKELYDIEHRIIVNGEMKWVREKAGVELDDKVKGIRATGTVQDITEHKRAEEDLKESFERLRRSLESTVSVLAWAVEMRDPYTAGHQQRVTDLACAIATEMGLSEEQVHGIRLAGLIHDIGKLNIPSEILNKPGQLKEIEYGFFKIHPEVGHDVLKTVEFPWPVAQIVLQHHERIDGSGYPQGLSGDEIILEARILAVADIVEAIASHRPYRPARGIGDALEEILHNKGIFYDPEVVDACLRVFYDKGFKFEQEETAATLPKIHRR